MKWMKSTRIRNLKKGKENKIEIKNEREREERGKRKKILKVKM